MKRLKKQIKTGLKSWVIVYMHASPEKRFRRIKIPRNVAFTCAIVNILGTDRLLRPRGGVFGGGVTIFEKG